MVDSNTTQCTDPSDCAGIPGTVCGPEGVCVDPAAAGECSTNQDCIDANDGLPSICRKPQFTCTQLVNSLCNGVIGHFENDDAIVYGFMNIYSGPPELLVGGENERGVELAVKEFDSAVVGIPGPGQRPRPLVFVTCDEAADPEGAATFLADEVGVPLIIGPASSANTVKISQNVTKQREVLLLSPSATAASLTDLDDAGLVWRVAQPNTDEAPAIAAVLLELEAELEAQLAGAPLKVALLVRNDLYGESFSDSLRPQLTFNMVNDVVNQMNQNLLARTYDFTNGSDMSDAAAQVVEFEPHVVILLTANEGITSLATDIELGWPLAVTRPQYILPSELLSPSLIGAVGSAPMEWALETRIRGVRPAAYEDRAPYKAFLGDYADEYEGTPGPFTHYAYDAVYLTAYATVSAGPGGTLPTEQLTGRDLITGLGMLVGGAQIDVGQSKISPALKALDVLGGRIDIEGASGALDFNTVSGEPTGPIFVWCVSVDTAGNPSFSTTPEFFDPREPEKGLQSGPFSCPPG